MKDQIRFDSAGTGKIAAVIWKPDAAPVGVVQIIHGIAEHSQRYEDFAHYLNSLGYLVVAQDHMGHGLSVELGSTKGYFYGGWWAAIDDVCTLLRITKEEFPDIPYILFGHSMGSFMARTILVKYPDLPINGCVICGTGWQQGAVLGAGLLLARAICLFSDPSESSALLQNLAFGSYNKRISQIRTPYDWLTRDHAVVDAYVEDSMCGFTASAGLMRDMFSGISYIQKQSNLIRMKKDLPVMFIAGDADPVGNYGKGVLKTVKAFKSVGMQCVVDKIYPDGRHEILNELNKHEVYEDVSLWIGSIINCTK